jgi:hypothetical protein
MTQATRGIARAVGLVAGSSADPFDAPGRPTGSARAAAPLGPGALLCVYREENAGSTIRLAAQAREAGMEVVLWALREQIASLAPFTVGAGPGLRMDLLNRLWATVARSTYQQVVIADDDVALADGSLARLRAAALRCGFGIAQPAHRWRSGCSYAITRRRWFTLARHTTFVEPGPLYIVSAPWVHHVLPFPDGFGMGYGLWLLWRDLQARGCRLGIIDGVTIHHPRAIATEYDVEAEVARMRELLRARGLSRPVDAQRTLGTWRVWAAEPPWTRGSAPTGGTSS